MILDKLALAKDYLANPSKYASRSHFNFGDHECKLYMRSLEEVLGAPELGHGAFGRVFDLSPRTVLKIASDPNYEAFANYVQSKNGSNPYLPRIYYRTRVDEYQLYVLEKLEPLSWDTDNDENSWHNTFVNYFDSILMLRRSGVPVELTCDKLKEILDEFGTDNMQDVASKNCMRRGNQLVITDPCSCYYGERYASRS